MSKVKSSNKRRVNPVKTWAVTICGGVIAGLLAFIQVATLVQMDAIGSDLMAGELVGYGLGVGAVVCLICYFLVLKRAPKFERWLGFVTILLPAVAGAVFAASL